MNLPQFSTLVQITDLTDKELKLQLELKDITNQLEMTKSTYTAKLVQDEREIKQIQSVKNSRQHISEKISELRENERKLKQQIDKKMEEIVKQNSIVDEEIKTRLFNKILSKIQ